METVLISKDKIFGSTMKIDWKKLNKNPNSYVKNLTEKQLMYILTESSKYYYNTGKTIIPDNIYDIVENALRKKNPRSSIFKDSDKQPVGGVKLPFNMPSLDKVKPDDGSLEKWKAKFPGPYVLSDKEDGLSLGLDAAKNNWKIYKKASSNISNYGSEVSRYAPFMNIPSPKKGYQIRAEAIIRPSVFKKYYSDKGANARNYASGILNPHRKSPSKALKHINVVAYEVIKPRMKPSAQFSFLKSMGFKIPAVKKVKDVDSAMLSEYLQKRKKESKFEIDGIVITQDKVHPRPASGNFDYSVAFKMVLGEQIAVVKVKQVKWSLSKDGYFKPVVIIPPTKLNNVTIRKATGFNGFFIKNGYKQGEENKKRKPIGPGAVIKIIRSGDVIPHILEVVKGADKPQMPDNDYVWTETGVDIYTPNKKKYKEISIKRITNFFRTIGSTGVDIGIVTKLYNSGLDTILKVVKATKKQLLDIPGIQEKTATKIVDNIEESLEGVALSSLMDASGAFGRNMGTTRLDIICKKYPDILSKNWDEDKLYDKITAINNFSDATAQDFIDGLPKFKKFYSKIKKYVTIVKPKKLVITSKKLKGQAICFTGFRNKQLEEIIVKNGGKIVGGVNSNTTILVIKDINSGSSKIEKARGLGIKIYTEQKFRSKYKI